METVVDLTSKGLVALIAAILIGRRTGNSSGAVMGGIIAGVIGAVIGVTAGELGLLLYRTLDKSVIGAIAGVGGALALGSLIGFGVSVALKNMMGDLAGDKADVYKAMVIGGILGAVAATLFGSWI
ncbi:MAG: hypothetical protein EXR67_01490 [Dehalococcoidia bacterium]|nr:hypothetical protein [Dehalococcoidia bacterium]